MKNTILSILVLTLFIIAPCCTKSFRKPICNGCDIQAVVKLGESLDKKELEDIFCSIQPDCIDENVEFSEVANEAIFEALRMNPELFVEVFDKERSYKKRLILEMIESPINDRINIQVLAEKVSTVVKHQKSVKSILTALENGRMKY